jgi:hypothetical protein
MPRLIGGEPLVRGGQHIGKILAPEAGPWLEAAGTEPNGIIGLHVWDENAHRGFDKRKYA